MLLLSPLAKERSFCGACNTPPAHCCDNEEEEEEEEEEDGEGP